MHGMSSTQDPVPTSEWILPKRKRTHLPDHDYAAAGAYFVTVCTHGRECRFGDVVNGLIRLNAIGEVVATVWQDIPRHFPNVGTDEFILMPNHLHGILIFFGHEDDPATESRPPRARMPGPKRASLASIIGAFKSSASRHINAATSARISPLWQRGYYDHVVRSDDALDRVREYIRNNPLSWALDEDNPSKHVVHPSRHTTVNPGLDD